MTQKNNHKLRIGIVGAGNIVRTRHLPTLKKHPEVEIVAVSNSTYESSEKFCREHLPHATPIRNWPELIALPDLDIIWIGTPPYMHSAVTISALEAGKHVFCQARMSMDLAEAEEMLAASKRYPELVTMLCPPPFGIRADLLVKKILAEIQSGVRTDRRAGMERPLLLQRAAGFDSPQTHQRARRAGFVHVEQEPGYQFFGRFGRPVLQFHLRPVPVQSRPSLCPYRACRRDQPGDAAHAERLA